MREILNNKKLNVKPVGFIDDDTLKVGKRLQGFPILGAFNDLEMLIKKYSIDNLLISFNHNDSDKLHLIKNFCRDNNLTLKQFTISVTDLDTDT